MCVVGGADLADWLVRQGLALDWPRYSKGRYSKAQHEARKNERGGDIVIACGLVSDPAKYSDETD